ncbi:Asparagine-rich zinc finger protein AZF1 [Cytospora mali]|uniref:Asparagine-rich zinc finger protein AZF1 n=1 Tax=Cytospora mali TaxID=578113 RepID=A0A194VF22_CYTMA|nr:Asparagine-rich zinc finger protein AZF1 [Valsa mali var. pyri (nom. inval.)]
MTPYQQATASHNWGRWTQHPPSSDYVTIDTVMPYETRAMPTSAPIQRQGMTPQYVVANPYGESPVTPVSASTYAGQGHFGEYGSYNQPSSALATPYQQQSGRSSQRPMAPPTPPLDDDSRSTHSRSSQATYSAKCMSRRSSAMNTPIVKSEQSGAPKEPKTIRPFKKIDGTLQHEVNTDMDLLLKEIAKVMEIEGAKGNVESPAPVESPEEEEEQQKPEAPNGPPKKFKCDLPDCDRAFAQKAQKISHMNSHNGIKKYRCDECGVCVSQAGNLQTHKRTHNNERPFPCPLCGKRFKQKGNVKPHIENVHEKKRRWICKFYDEGGPRCGKDFSTIGNMKNHINGFHKKTLQEIRYRLANWSENDRLSEEDKELFAHYLMVYKNSNKGVKGRGKSDKVKDEPEAARAALEGRRETTQQMTPVSPDPSNMGAVAYSRPQFYEQQQHHPHNQHFQGLPPPASHHQASHYAQMPMHHAQQQSYPGLPQPVGYSMGWAPQYH